ncbi:MULTISPECIES: hypothetical protein [unclassified Rahnella]|uniref:hypothetical protein n=1 Tax=unclassified Rahnella TaxID=2635087 RepID=UPI00055A0B09|nr:MULTISPECIES: hypothetical protein [unclassified Rahnella]
MSTNSRLLEFINFLIIKVKNMVAFIVYHSFGFAFAPLVIFGPILCIMFVEPWPLKFVSIGVWLVFLYFLSKVIDKITGRDKRDN